MKTYLIILTLIFCIQPGFGQALFDEEPMVRVLIIHSADPLQISFNTPWLIDTSDLQTSFMADSIPVRFSIKNDRLTIRSTDQNWTTDTSHLRLRGKTAKASLVIKDVPYGTGWWWEGKEDRIYEGEILIHKQEKDTLDVVVVLPLEQYLKGVVPYEIGGDAPLEALKAQAVAARSEAVIALTSKLYSGPYYDLTSDVECQVFSGNKKRTDNADLAVEQTRGIILSENGTPINAYYASNCGGHSELIRNVWPERPEPVPYRQALTDSENRTDMDLSSEEKVRNWIFSTPAVYCNPNLGTPLPSWSQKNFRWHKRFTTDSISTMLAGEQSLGLLKNIKALKRGRSGRMYLARFIFEQDSFDVKGELAIRQMWRPSLRSACFVVDKKDGTFILNGAGWGHGVGMCQSGAVSQAEQGRTFYEILKHYYDGATLMNIY